MYLAVEESDFSSRLHSIASKYSFPEELKRNILDKAMKGSEQEDICTEFKYCLDDVSFVIMQHY